MLLLLLLLLLVIYCYMSLDKCVWHFDQILMFCNAEDEISNIYSRRCTIDITTRALERCLFTLLTLWLILSSCTSVLFLLLMSLTVLSLCEECIWSFYSRVTELWTALINGTNINEVNDAISVDNVDVVSLVIDNPRKFATCILWASMLHNFYIAESWITVETCVHLFAKVDCKARISTDKDYMLLSFSTSSLLLLLLLQLWYYCIYLRCK